MAMAGSNSSVGQILFQAIAILAPVLMALYGFVLVSHKIDDALTSLIYLLWVVGLFVFFVPFMLEYKNINPFSPLIIISVTEVFSLMQPIYFILNDWRGAWVQFETIDMKYVLLQFLVFFIIGKIVFYIFYYRSLSSRVSSNAFARLFWIKESWRLVLLTFIVGFIFYLVLMQQNGGVFAYLNSLHARRQMNEGNGWLMLFIYLMLISGWVSICLKKSKTPTFIDVLINSVIFLILLSLGGRGLAFKYLLIAMFIYNYRRAQISAPLLAIIFVVGFFSASAIQDFRSATATGGAVAGIDAVINGSRTEDAINDTQELERTLIVLQAVPDQQEYTYFSTYSSLLTSLIPRKLYPEKPGLSEAAVYAHLFTGDTSGLIGVYPAGNIGDFYMQAGILGIIIMFAMQGFVCAWAFSLIRENKNVGTLLLYAVIVIYGGYKLRNLFIFQSALILLSLFVVAKFSRLKVVK